VRFKVLITVKISLWPSGLNTVLCSRLYQRFGWTYCLHLQGRSVNMKKCWVMQTIWGGETRSPSCSLPNTNFHRNPFNSFGDVICWETDRTSLLSVPVVKLAQNRKIKQNTSNFCFVLSTGFISQPNITSPPVQLIVSAHRYFMRSFIFLRLMQSRLAANIPTFRDNLSVLVPCSRFKKLFLDCLNLGDGTDRLPRNVGN
jgi:hypothetical protein